MDPSGALVGLHHWHMICKITAFFILWSIFGQCGDGGSCDQGRNQDFISTEVRSPQAPPMCSDDEHSNQKECIYIYVFVLQALTSKH